MSACPRFAKAPSSIWFGSGHKKLLTKLRWSKWGTPAATASGVLRQKTASGRYAYKSMTASASDIGPCDGLRTYERLVVSTRG